ncbi:MAG: hypothetical protein HKN83_09885 [Gammaproteobacteria bacterium]|nr:hypothetical protein [Gammaproteobacteria bacterium]
MSFQWSWRRSRIGFTLVKYLITLVSLSVILIGCSGGGGGGGAAVNPAPVITAGCSTTFEAGDYDPGGFFIGVHTGTLTATDSDPISFSLDVANPMVAGPMPTANGGSVMLTDVTTGAFTYTPPAGGPRGTDSFPFRVDDPTSFSTDTQTVIVNPKIMPLGDSITQGVDGFPPVVQADRIAYRLELLNQLNTAGFFIQYVGELTSGINFLTAAQFLHNGYGACEDQHIAFGGCNASADGMLLDGIFAELDANPADIVLLHIGTNPAMVDTSAADTRTILTEIGRWEDSMNGNPVTVLVARIIDRLPADPAVATRNANVDAMIAAGPMMGEPWPDQVIFGADVDMFNALYSGGMPDPALYPMVVGTAIHPNQDGHDVMGGVWATALTGPSKPAILQACP